MSTPPEFDNGKVSTEYRDVEQGRPAHHNEDLGRELQGVDIGPRGFYGHVGNPGVLGLAAHAVTLMLLSVQFMGFRGVGAPQVYVGNLWFFAGLYMFSTSQWCLVKGETFAACVFGVFSGFYLSYAAILTPAFNVAATFASGTAGEDAGAEYQSLAMFLLIWNGAFFVIFLASLRTNLALVVVFLGVILGVWLIAGMYLQLAAVANLSGGSAKMATALSKAGGACLFFSASSGFYLVLVQLTESVDFPFALPVGDLTPYWPKKKSS